MPDDSIAGDDGNEDNKEKQEDKVEAFTVMLADNSPNFKEQEDGQGKDRSERCKNEGIADCNRNMINKTTQAPTHEEEGPTAAAKPQVESAWKTGSLFLPLEHCYPVTHRLFLDKEKHDNSPASQQKVLRKQCNHEGCTTNAVKGGFCIRHGGVRSRGKCRQEGCTNLSHIAGFCKKHGLGPKFCSHEGCVSQAYAGGVCRKHWAARALCRHSTCTN